MSSKKQAERVRTMRERTTRLDRAGDYWTEEEKEILVQKFMAGEGITAIALELQRSEPAVYQMIEKLDLYNRKNQPIRHRTKGKPKGCLCKKCENYPALCPGCPDNPDRQEVQEDA